MTRGASRPRSFLSVWSMHLLSVCSHFLPQTKDIPIRWAGDCLSFWKSLWVIFWSSGTTFTCTENYVVNPVTQIIQLQIDACKCNNWVTIIWVSQVWEIQFWCTAHYNIERLLYNGFSFHCLLSLSLQTQTLRTMDTFWCSQKMAWAGLTVTISFLWTWSKLVLNQWN